MKNEHVWYVCGIVIVTTLSFLATFWLDRFGVALVCLPTGWVVAYRCPAPSLMDERHVRCHVRAALLALPYLVASVAPLFLVNELTRRGVGYALSGCAAHEVWWAALMSALFAAGFFDGRVNQKPAF